MAVFLPLATSHNLMVPCLFPEARVLPSGLNATELTAAEVPFEGGGVLAAGHIPQPDRLLISATGGQGLAVRAERYGHDNPDVSIESGSVLRGWPHPIT